jgi:ureidoacrylate peracid hydrolase
MAAKAKLIETLGPDHTALVLFDTLHGYLHPTDPKKKAFLDEHKVLPNLTRLLRSARRAGLRVFYPSGDHAADGSDTAARLTDTDMDLRPWPNGALKAAEKKSIAPKIRHGSKDAEIARELKPRPGFDVVVPKHRWSSFFQTHLELALRTRGLDTVILAGGSTDVGIASTAFAARDLDIGLVVVSDACYSARGDNNRFFMERVFPRMGRVMTVQQTIELMLRGAGKKK